MGLNYKIVWRKIGARTIPIKESLKGAPSELQKIMHKQRAMQSLKVATSEIDPVMHGMFYKVAKRDSKIAGEKIAMRISRLAKIARRIK